MPSSTRRITLRRSDRCTDCGCDLPVGERAIWDSGARLARCLHCGDSWSGGVDVRASVAGASARRQGERRRERRETKLRRRWGPLGGVAVAMSSAPQHERAWDDGAEAEEKLARELERLTAAHGVKLLHDRRVPRSRANIDHLAIGPTGVTVIDAKRYAGRIAVERRGGLLRERTAHLLVGGRDKTKLVDGVLAQAEVVRSVLDAAVPVRAVLCFVDGDWPLLGQLEVRGVPVLPPRKAAKLCRADGPLSPSAIEQFATKLARALPPA